MFRFAGWSVIIGFALYGANTFFKSYVIANKGNATSDRD